MSFRAIKHIRTMTYKDIINQLATDLRASEVWPTGLSRLEDQLIRVYAAVLVVAREAPIKLLSVVDSDPIISASGDYNVTDLPEALFIDRADIGFVSIDMDGREYYLSNQSEPNLMEVATANRFASGVPMFRLDPSNKKLHTVNSVTTTLKFIETPEKPTDENYDDENFVIPLRPLEIESVIQLVSAHVNGLRARDPQMANYNSMLFKLYGAPQPMPEN